MIFRIIYIFLFLFSWVLVFLSFDEIKNDFETKNKIEKRNSLIKENLEKICIIEKEHRKEKGFYQKNIDSIIQFVKSKKYIKTRRKYVLDTLTINNKDSIVKTSKIVTIRTILLKDSIFKRNYNLKKLFLLADSKTNKKIDIKVLKFKLPNNKIKEKFIVSYKKKELLIDLNKVN